MKTFFRLLITLAVLLPFTARAQTAASRTSLYSEIDAQLPTNGTGGITAATLRAVLKDLTASMYVPITDGTVLLANTLTTKGDLLVRGTSALARLPIGTDGQVLVVDSTQLYGVKWATASGSGDMLASAWDTDSNGAIDLLKGGTNATTAAGARTNLGLVIGTDVAPASHTHTAAQISDSTAAGRALLTAADVAAQKAALSLGNVDNTSDANKPVSTAQQTALNLKATLTALAAVNGSGPNAVNGLVDWSQLKGVPAGFADGTDDGAGGGSGTVTTISAGNLSPLFTSSVANPTTTPIVTFTASVAAQNSVLAGPVSGGSGAYGFRSLAAADIPSLTLSKISDAGTAASKATVTTSAGAGDVGKIPLLDSTGKLDASALPASGSSLPTQTSNEGGALVTNGTSARWNARLGPLGVELTAAQRSLVFEGDSLTSIQPGNVEWPNRLMGEPGISSRGTYANFGQSGGVISDAQGRYTANVHPLRPGVGSIKEAWLAFWCGTNNCAGGTQTGDQIYTEYKAYMQGAKTDGFKLIAFTLQDVGFTGASETARLRFNELVRAEVGFYDIVIPNDQLFPSVSDLTWFDGGIHLNNTGRQHLADFVYGKLLSGDGTPLPFNSISAGTSDPQFPTNAILKGTVRAFTKAQTQTRKTLTEASPIVWDQSDAQIAAVTLTANRTLSQPTGATSGGIYYLDVQYGGSYAITWPTNFKWPAGTAPTQTSATDKLDRYEFEFQGTYWLGRSVGVNYAIPAPSNVVWQEESNPVGSDQSIGGTSPDTITSGNNWVVPGGSFTRINSTGTISSSGSNAVAYVDAGIADGVLEGKLFGDFNPSALLFNYVDANNYYLLWYTGGNTVFVYQNLAGSFGLVHSASVTGSGSAGDILKIDKTGSSVTYYFNGATLFGGAQSDSAGSTSTKWGIWSQGSTGKYDSIKFSHH